MTKQLPSIPALHRREAVLSQGKTEIPANKQLTTLKESPLLVKSGFLLPMLSNKVFLDNKKGTSLLAAKPPIFHCIPQTPGQEVQCWMFLSVLCISSQIKLCQLKLDENLDLDIYRLSLEGKEQGHSCERNIKTDCFAVRFGWWG